MANKTIAFLWITVASLARQQVMAKDVKQVKSEQTEKKADDKQVEANGKAEAEEETETEPLADSLGRSAHLPRYLEMLEEPPESSPAKLGELREEKEQLEVLIKQDRHIVQAIKQGFEQQQSALPQHEWKAALVASKRHEAEVQQRIARNLGSLEKVKNELTFLTGVL